MPELGGLVTQRRDQMGMGVSERIDGNARGKIQISATVLGEEVRALAANERKVRPTIGWQQIRKQSSSPSRPMCWRK